MVHVFNLEYKTGRQLVRWSCKLTGKAAGAKITAISKQENNLKTTVQLACSGNEHPDWVASHYPPDQEALVKQLEKKINALFCKFRAGLNPAGSHLISIHQ